MNITEAFLLVSLLINVAFVLGIPILLFVRFLLRRTRWRIIGQGANGVDFREGRPRNGFFTWKSHGKTGFVAIDQKLVGTATDGRPVLWVDTDTCHQIAPTRITELGALPKELETVEHEYAQLPGFKGRATNDLEQTTVQGADGKVKGLSYHVWTRISGWRLFKVYRDIRISQLNDPNAGLAALAQVLMPLGMIVAIGLLITLVIMGV